MDNKIEFKSVLTIENKNHKMEVLDNGILLITHNKDTELEVSDVEEMRVAFNSIKDPKPRKVIQDIRSNVNITTEARKYAAEHSPDLLGVAYVISGLPERILLSFYVRMWKRDKPTQFFKSIKEAVDWLESL